MYDIIFVRIPWTARSSVQGFLSPGPEFTPVHGPATSPRRIQFAIDPRHRVRIRKALLKLIVKKMVAEYEIIKTEKEKLEKENSKLKEEIAEMIRVNESIFESGSKLDIRPEDLPNRFSKLLPVPYRHFRFTIMQSYD